MAVHFCPALTVISVTRVCVNRSNSGVPGVASGPRTAQFRESASALKRTARPHDGRVAAQGARGRGGPGDAEHVLSRERVKDAVRWGADQLDGAFGEDAGRDDAAEHQLRQVGGLARGFHHGRQARQQSRRELLQHAPHGKVECVDLHGRALPRHMDVTHGEGALLADQFHVAVGQDMPVGQLFGALAAVDEEHPDAAVDIEHGVPAGRSGAGGQCVELVRVRGEMLAERLEQTGALVEGQLAQGRAAHLPRVTQHGCGVDGSLREPGHLGAGRRVQQGTSLVGCLVPVTGEVAVQFPGHGGSTLRVPVGDPPTRQTLY